MKFTNGAIERERKSIKNLMWVWILLFVLSFVFLYWAFKEEDKANKNIKDLHSIIISNDEAKEGKKSYVNINSVPYKFAIYNGLDEAYYFVMDEKYMYVVYMDDASFKVLNNEEEYNNSKKIEGITKQTPSEIKKLAIETYNEAMENEDDKLVLADYDSYFGSVHLDMTESESTSGLQYLLFFITFILSIIIFIIERIRNYRFKKSIKRLSDSEIMKIDSEMNDPKAFYYKKAHLYLTDNYVINFMGALRVINYDDIVWVYPFEYRTNGIKTSQSIIVITKDGKKHNIASLDVITKSKKEMYNEIFNTIVSKNKNIIVGYTKEAKEKASEILSTYKK